MQMKDLKSGSKYKQKILNYDFWLYIMIDIKDNSPGFYKTEHQVKSPYPPVTIIAPVLLAKSI